MVGPPIRGWHRKIAALVQQDPRLHYALGCATTTTRTMVGRDRLPRLAACGVALVRLGSDVAADRGEGGVVVEVWAGSFHERGEGELQVRGGS